MGLRQRIAEGIWVVADTAGIFLSGFGAITVALLGKVMLAVVLGAIALGFFLRLVGRRGVRAAEAPRLGLRYQVPSALVAAVEVALLTEATNLPVRFDQPGFQAWHWGLVLVALVVAYAFNMLVCRRLFWKVRVVPQSCQVPRNGAP